MRITTTRLVTTSDRTGRELSPENHVKIVVRKHPDIERSKRLDVSRWEASRVPGARDNVEYTLQYADGHIETRTCTQEEFDSFIKPNTLAEASAAHGRQKGFTPKAVNK